jgi:chromosome segregation ATPase
VAFILLKKLTKDKNMSVLGAAALAGTAISPLVSGISSWLTNKTNAKIAGQTNALQESLSNTAYQRSTADLISAGLNPVLAYTKGTGASTPQMQMARMESPFANLTNSAAQAARLGAEIEKLQSDSRLSKAAANKADQEAETQASIRDTNTALQGKYQQEVLESKARARQIDSSIEHIVSQIGHIDDQIKTAKLGRQMTTLKMEREKLFNQLFKEGNSAIDVYRDIYKNMNIDKPVKLYYDLKKAKDDYYKTLKRAWRNPAKYVAEEFMNAVKKLRK